VRRHCAARSTAVLIAGGITDHRRHH
jgi:hypothetical protein